jgi:hypothetical protein
LKKLFLLTIIFISTQSLAEQPSKPFGLQFTEMYTQQVLVENYTKQLKGRIFEAFPKYQAQEKDVEEWLSIIFNSGKFNTLLAQRYQKIFTEQEFKDLLDFYNSDTGKKFMTIAPQMSAISASVAGKIVHESLLELHDYLEARKEN